MAHRTLLSGESRLRRSWRASGSQRQRFNAKPGGWVRARGVLAARLRRKERVTGPPEGGGGALNRRNQVFAFSGCAVIRGEQECGHHQARRFKAACGAIERARRLVACFRQHPSLAAAELASEVEQRRHQRFAKPLPLMGWRHAQFIDPELEQRTLDWNRKRRATQR